MTQLILWTSMNREHSNVRCLGAYHIASWLRSNGYDVKVIDFCHSMSRDELISITEKYITDKTVAIGVSSTFWHDYDLVNDSHKNKVKSRFVEPDWVIDARNILEEKYPKLYWILGGTSANRGIKEKLWIEMQGFAEDEILRWMDNNCSKFKRRNPFDIYTSVTKFSENDYIQPHEILPMELGRGCVFSCKFCSFPLIGKKKGSYLRDIENIKTEILENYEKWGTTRYFFVDDTVNEDEDKMIQIANFAQRLPFRLEWVGYVRADLIWARKGSSTVLRDSGLRSAFFGVESLHPEASRAVGKGWMGKKFKEYSLQLKKEWENKITWKVALITGLPGETKDDILNTHKWCKDNGMYEWNFGPLYITRDSGKVWKSEFELNYEKYGYTFPENNDNWKNKHFTYRDAFALSRTLSLEARNNYNCATAFDLGQYVGLGYTFDDLILTKRKDMNYQEFKIKKDEFMKKYITFQTK